MSSNLLLTVRRRIGSSAQQLWCVMLLCCVVLPLFVSARRLAPPSAPPPPAVPKHPVIIFPAYAFSRLSVQVNGQKFEPSCPPDGRFEVHYPGYATALPSGWNENCATKMLALDVTLAAGSKPTFANKPGVQTKLANFGGLNCAPYYQPLISFLTTTLGYIEGKDIAVACNDFRFTPNTAETGGTTNIDLVQALVQTIYTNSGGRPVYLLGHSNGPLYAKGFLDAMSPAFKEQYIAGFIPIAGNWPGQGFLTSVLFSGLNIDDFSLLPDTAPVFETFPSTYMSSARPDVFSSQIKIIADPSNTYTPKDYDALYADAGFTLAPQLHPYYIGSISMDPPQVHVTSVYGSGITTVVGAAYTDPVASAIGTLPTGSFDRDGDGNQEDIVNESNFPWETQDTCHTFTTIHIKADPITYPAFTSDPAFHFNLPFSVNAQLQTILTTPLPAPLC